MFKSQTLERNSSTYVWLITPQLVFLLRSAIVAALSVMLCLAALPGRSNAQSADTRSLDAYSNAVKQSVINARIQGMEQFLNLAGNSGLKADGLEFLVWDYMRTGNRAQSTNRAQELLKIDPANPLAIAAVNDSDSSVQGAASDVLNQAKQALGGIEKLRQPEGMTQSEFQLLKNNIAAKLNGIAGLTFLRLNDYEGARNYLKQAVTAAPDNSRYVYGLALALLLGKNPDVSNGYWYLAKAVNLTRGTEAGQQISTFARNRYQQDGGSDAAWNQFLVATGNGIRKSSPSPAASSTFSPQPERDSRRSSAHNTEEHPSALATNLPALPASEPPEPASSATGVQANHKMVPASTPVSLGILIQTALLKGKNRQEIVETLRDITRHLRSDDEAFIMAFSNQLDFEQDLTANNILLEEALDTLNPSSGAALFDGIAFAAGHLRRVGRNQNRVLLVISDGRNTNTQATSAPLSAQLHDVRIDCIGLEVNGADERGLLQRLAAYSGGRASFASDSQQFRAAAFQIAKGIGIDF